MKDLIDILKKIKQALKVPKIKSLTLLGIYLLFFIFVFVVLSSNKSNNIKNYKGKEDVNENKNIVESYEYEYKIIDKMNEKLITGTSNNNEEVLNYNNKRYYIKDNIIYIIENKLVQTDEQFPINIINYKYDNINKLIENSELVEKTIYKDNSEKIVYSIKADKYFNIFNELVCDSKQCLESNIKIIINKKEYINEVLIDLSEYYKYSYSIQIKYSNINNIQKISTLSQ